MCVYYFGTSFSRASSPNGGNLHSDQFIGRRGKRHKNSIKPAEGHDDSMPSEKATAGFESLEGQAKENVRSHANFFDDECKSFGMLFLKKKNTLVFSFLKVQYADSQHNI